MSFIISIAITRNNNSFSTVICHKTTLTVFKTSFNSFISAIYKHYALRSLAHRVIQLPSNYKSITRELNKLTKHLY